MRKFKLFRLPTLAAGLLALVWSCGGPQPLGVDNGQTPTLTKPVRGKVLTALQSDEAFYSKSRLMKIVDRAGDASPPVLRQEVADALGADPGTIEGWTGELSEYVKTSLAALSGDEPSADASGSES
jgi:hypothetical protein